MWIVAIIVVLLIWGNLSRKSPNHPLNRVQINPKYPLKSNEPTAGDNFNSGNSIVAGINEPCRIGMPSGPDIPGHVFFPIDPPPPIAIQVPKVSAPLPVKTAVPVSQMTKPNVYICDASVWSGSGGSGNAAGNLWGREVTL